MESRILVKEFMKPLKLSFTPETTVEAVVHAMLKSRVSAAPVLNGGKQLVGFITHQDCIKQMLNDTYYCEDHALAESIMYREPLSVSPEDDIVKIAQMIIDNKPKNYPVVEEGKVIGMISREDILAALDLNRTKACRTG